MTDDVQLGPDPNQVRRHAKKMLTEAEYRRKYRRIDFYKPNVGQLEFHNQRATEVCLRAGNQLGKTTAGCAELTFAVTSDYPAWHMGRQLLTAPAIERPYAFVGWAGCTTSTTTRDGAQLKLLGNVTQADGLGTGLIPLDAIVGRPEMARGIADFADFVLVRRADGSTAQVQFKTYEMKRTAWQGSSVDFVLLDEDPGFGPPAEIYGEALARLTATKGIIRCTLTPMPGITPLRKRYIEGGPDLVEVRMGLRDASHIPASEHATIRGRYKESERATRTEGDDMMGEGLVFVLPEELISHRRDPATFPIHWPWLWGVDFSHAGMSASAHPFAAVLGCHDRDNDVIYIVDAIRMRQALPWQHVARIKESPCWDAPVAWPRDGHVKQLTGVTFAETYRKLGLAMLGSHAQFKDGSVDFEAGISEMEQRFASGCLLVAAHLQDWWDEYRSYHRTDNEVHKLDDDLLSATRQLVMQIRSAKILTNADEPGQNYRSEGPQGYRRRRLSNAAFNTPEAIAARGDFNPFTGRVD